MRLQQTNYSAKRHSLILPVRPCEASRRSSGDKGVELRCADVDCRASFSVRLEHSAQKGEVCHFVVSQRCRSGENMRGKIWSVPSDRGASVCQSTRSSEPIAAGRQSGVKGRTGNSGVVEVRLQTLQLQRKVQDLYRGRENARAGE
jgi:hypothetical protein